MFSALVIYRCAAEKTSLFIRFLELRPLVYLGSASYAIYLLQEPVHLVLARAGIPLLLFYPILVGASAIVFTFYEEPMRKSLRGRHVGSRTGAPPIIMNPQEQQ